MTPYITTFLFDNTGTSVLLQEDPCSREQGTIPYMAPPRTIQESPNILDHCQQPSAWALRTLEGVSEMQVIGRNETVSGVQTIYVAAIAEPAVLQVAPNSIWLNMADAEMFLSSPVDAQFLEQAAVNLFRLRNVPHPATNSHIPALDSVAELGYD